MTGISRLVLSLHETIPNKHYKTMYSEWCHTTSRDTCLETHNVPIVAIPLCTSSKSHFRWVLFTIFNEYDIIKIVLKLDDTNYLHQTSSVTDAVPCPTSLSSWHVYSPASVFKTGPKVSDGFWTVPPVYLESVVTLMTSWPFFHVTLFTGGLAPCDRHVMVTDCPSTTGSGVTTETVGLSTTCEKWHQYNAYYCGNQQ